MTDRYTIAEVSQVTGYSPAYLRNQIRKGKIKSTLTTIPTVSGRHYLMLYKELRRLWRKYPRNRRSTSPNADFERDLKCLSTTHCPRCDMINDRPGLLCSECQWECADCDNTYSANQTFCPTCTHRMN